MMGNCGSSLHLQWNVFLISWKWTFSIFSSLRVLVRIIEPWSISLRLQVPQSRWRSRSIMSFWEHYVRSLGEKCLTQSGSYDDQRRLLLRKISLSQRFLLENQHEAICFLRWSLIVATTLMSLPYSVVLICQVVRRRSGAFRKMCSDFRLNSDLALIEFLSFVSFHSLRTFSSWIVFVKSVFLGSSPKQHKISIANRIIWNCEF